MLIFDIKYLVGVLIGIDIIFFIIIIRLLNRFRYFKRNASLGKEIETFESLIKDTDQMVLQFNKQIQEKHHFIDNLNAKLDKRISGLKMLINRADILLSQSNVSGSTDNSTERDLNSHQTAIMNLARQGFSTEEIAQKLSIQRGEVTLVLNMK
jgi:peptidoglycan hydrolase CwlO-like protein